MPKEPANDGRTAMLSHQGFIQAHARSGSVSSILFGGAFLGVLPYMVVKMELWSVRYQEVEFELTAGRYSVNRNNFEANFSDLWMNGRWLEEVIGLR